MIGIPHLLEWVKAVVASCFQFMMMMMMRSLYFCCGDSGLNQEMLSAELFEVSVLKLSINLQDG